MSPDDEKRALQQQLDRLTAALGEKPAAPGAWPPRPPAPPRPPTPPSPPPLPERSGLQKAAPVGLVLALALVAMAVATGHAALVVPGILLAVFSIAQILYNVLNLPGPRDPTRAHIGLGATVQEGAVVEPGAVIEMGATVRSGAVVKRGAIVRMGATVRENAVLGEGAIVGGGATVRENAVLEEGAVVGWGATVQKGAVVGRSAAVGAGSTVKKGAHVPAGMRLAPGSTFAQGRSAAFAPAHAPAPPVPADPRRARIEDACQRIQAELRHASPQIREYLGTSEQTVESLRATCASLMDREKALRAESSAEALAFLDQERAELDRRIAAATDAAVKASLESAVRAIDDQKRQREALRTRADRLDAEITRLQWTLDGMAAQLVRLRTAGLEAGAAEPGAEVLKSVQQLHDEIDAIASALEEVGRAGTVQPVSEISSEDAGRPGDERERTR